MSKLYFSYGRGESFTSMKLANKKNGYANPIRELMQNSLDASREAKNDKCVIDIYLEKVEKINIPNIKDYEEALKNSIKLLKSRGGYTSGNQQIVNSIKKEIQKDSIDVLMFVDNGTGMNQGKLENLLDEISNHADESAGGSYGVGHLSSYFLSSLRYILYATKFNGNNKIKSLFTGSTILAGHESGDTQRGSKGRIIAKVPKNEANPKFEYLTDFPTFIKTKMDKLETSGSMVAILGLNEKWGEDAEYAIASNFFHAIFYDRLEVNIHHDNKITVINNEKLKSLLYSRKDKGNARGSILSGQDVYQAYQAIQNNQNNIELNNQNKVYVYSVNKIKSSSCICLVRNGMLIARHDNMLSKDINNLRKNEDFEPFMVVVEVDKVDAKVFFKLIRDAENTYHNKLINKKESTTDDKKSIKTLFKELSEKIKDSLDKKDRENFNLNIPLLEIPNKAEAQGENTNKPKSQTSKAKSNINQLKQPINKVKKTNNGVKREAPIIVSRSLEAKKSMRMNDKGDVVDIEIDIVPSKIEVKDEVYLSISLAQDKDNDESGNALDFINLSMNGADVAIPEFVEKPQKDGSIEQHKADKSQIKLGKLLENKTYKVMATIKKPKNTGGVSIALKSFLGLKQDKGGKNE